MEASVMNKKIPKNAIRIFTVDGVKRADLILPNGSVVGLNVNDRLRREPDGYYDAKTGALIRLDPNPFVSRFSTKS